MLERKHEASPLLQRIIESFRKAIRTEMDAMRQRLGAFEVPLGRIRSLGPGQDDASHAYQFRILQANDKLLVHTECTLRYGGVESLVTISSLHQEDVAVVSDRPIPLGCDDYTLVIYPWFLYEKLQQALDLLLKSGDFYSENALLLFGHGQPEHESRPLRVLHPELNASQLRAVEVCSQSNVAFVWGPPGTGKTTTLGHIITELLGQGQRLLVTSTTNAAVDRALEELGGNAAASGHLQRGQIVRIGQTSGDTLGASLKEVVHRLSLRTEARLERVRERSRIATRQREQCGLLLAKVQAATQRLQLELFRPARSNALTSLDLLPVFGQGLAQILVQLPAKDQEGRLTLRHRRLQAVLELGRGEMARLNHELRQQETTVVQKAKVILATMTNVYLSNLLQPERFDAVIVEEAGMAILPTLFYCAALARSKVIVVGDPQQLPPIVQARDAYVHRAMGRTIFEVAADKSLTGQTMVMLDTQYRMHPLIGELVSRLFYDGRLRHGENTRQRDQIAAREPYPGSPVVVIDTAGQTTCATEAGGFSRFNEKTADRCVELAVQAVRAGVESVAIITPYVAQSRLIRQKLAGFGKEAAGVECRTVHRFQGNERDMVVLDTVDTAPLPPGLLLTDPSPQGSAPNLLNVSISRAKGKLIIVGDVGYFGRTASASVINKVLAQAGQTGIRVAFCGVQKPE